MGHAARVGDGLRTAALVLGPRDAILRPDLHRHANDVVTLLAQQIAGDAGIDPAAHTEKDALFLRVHRARKVGAIAGMVNAIEKRARFARLVIPSRVDGEGPHNCNQRSTVKTTRPLHS